MGIKSITDKKALKEKAHEAGTQVRAIYDHASEEVHEVAHHVEERIVARPLQSSLIALGAGVVLGLLLRRR